MNLNRENRLVNHRLFEQLRILNFCKKDWIVYVKKYRCSCNNLVLWALMWSLLFKLIIFKKGIKLLICWNIQIKQLSYLNPCSITWEDWKVKSDCWEWNVHLWLKLRISKNSNWSIILIILRKLNKSWKSKKIVLLISKTWWDLMLSKKGNFYVQFAMIMYNAKEI